jgi:hypothetical protein
MSLHICSPTGFAYRKVLDCPTCKCRRRMLVHMFVWYDTDITCLTCGESWANGERRQRPFAPGWRAQSVRWAKAVPFTRKAEALAALEAEALLYLADE